MSATPESSIATANVSPLQEALSDSTSMAQFRLAVTLYLGWSALAWLSQLAGLIEIPPLAAKIILLGIGATNLLFFLIARNNVLHRPPGDTITLAQCVVGIAWATLFTFMSSKSGELIMGVYASIILFAILRVRRPVLNQIIIFAVSSYMTVSLIKMLSTEPPSISPDSLMQVLIFAGVMLSMASAGRYVYRQQRRLESAFGEAKANNSENSVNRRYILDLLAREKGRADRSNVPFCICVLDVNHIESSSDCVAEDVRIRALKNIESIIRAELREMDFLNSSGSYECFGAYSDKEFIVILPQTNLSGARRAAERVIATFTTKFDLAESRVSLCGGIAQYHRGETIAALLARVEMASSMARTSGAGHVCDSERNLARSETHRAAIVRLETHRR